MIIASSSSRYRYTCFDVLIRLTVRTASPGDGPEVPLLTDERCHLNTSEGNIGKETGRRVPRIQKKNGKKTNNSCCWPAALPSLLFFLCTSAHNQPPSRRILVHGGRRHREQQTKRKREEKTPGGAIAWRASSVVRLNLIVRFRTRDQPEITEKRNRSSSGRP